MKNKFSQFYSLSEEKLENMWNKEAVFVFDTNILFKLYKFPEETSNEFIKIFKTLKSEDRIWIPYNVAYEYQQNRLNVINSQNKFYDKINDVLDKTYDRFVNELNRNFHPIVDIGELKSKVKKLFENIKNESKEKQADHPNWFEDDTIRKELDDIFSGVVGDKFDKSKLDEIYKEGKKRYKKEIAPGWKDKDKKSKKDAFSLDDEREYGDLVIWKQIIEFAKEEKKSIIFITDDKKEDWWLEKHGKTIGPCPELIKEIHEEANVFFHMYKSHKFLEYAKEYLDYDINNDVIKEVEEFNKTEDKKHFFKYYNKFVDNNIKDKHFNNINKFMINNINDLSDDKKMEYFNLLNEKNYSQEYIEKMDKLFKEIVKNSYNNISLEELYNEIFNKKNKEDEID